ncbi:hypothetical protein BKA70DRAFT_1096960, partial [Coprinopsis sp. MPI-PUGE-AT-0042]
PPITAYRLLVTACVIGFGSLKVVLSYRGFSTEPTSVEWIFGGGVAILIYCLGLYEASSTRTLPFLFETDYSKQRAVESTPNLRNSSDMPSLQFAIWQVMR